MSIHINTFTTDNKCKKRGDARNLVTSLFPSYTQSYLSEILKLT